MYFKGGNRFQFTLDYMAATNYLSYGIKIFFGSMVNFIHYRLDVFIINYLLSPASVGIYSIAAVMSEKVWLLSQSTGEMLFPKVASNKNDDESILFTIRIFKFVMILTI